MEPPMPLTRRIFRAFLFFILGVTFAGFLMVVVLRVAYRDRPITGPLQIGLLHADVAQHYFFAYFGDDSHDLRLANNLLSNSVFSLIYYDAGMKMLNELADKGYQPAIDRIEEIDKMRREHSDNMKRYQ